jgi:hypothetical protein
MGALTSYGARNGELVRSDESIINEGNYIAPIPNGDQAITMAAAGVQASLTPPNQGNIKAIISNPVATWIRFGATPAVNAGTYYVANQGIVLESAEEIAQCQFYATGAGTYFVQYFK